jgi:transcriptional/translational regulatory protein YebC/TACO1
MVSPSVALLIEVETDNKIRAMQDVRVALNKYSAAFSSTKFFFTRRGRVVFERTPETGSDEILDVAVEAGAEDVEEDDEGNVVVWTEPSGTARVCTAVEGAFGLRIVSSQIVWAPNEESNVTLDEVGDVQRVTDLVAALRDVPDVQAVYCNASKGAVADEEWSKLESSIDT